MAKLKIDFEEGLRSVISYVDDELMTSLQKVLALSMRYDDVRMEHLLVYSPLNGNRTFVRF